MTDARNWGTHQTSFLEIAGSTIIPLGDRIHTRVTVGGNESFEIFRQGKYVVLEGEVGNARMRVGTLLNRAVTLSAGADTLTFGSAHPYETGDGPLRIDAVVKMQGTGPSTPTLQFDQIAAANDKIIRNGGSWVTDGFAVADSITITGGGANDGAKTIAAISTTTNPNDTLEFAGDVLTDLGPGIANVRVVKGSEPTGVVAGVDYWIIKVDATTIKLAASYGNALAGVAVDIIAAPSGPWEIGGWQGSWSRVGFNPTSAQTSSDGESHKLLRAAEQVIVTGKSVTVCLQGPGDIVKWWNVG